MCKDVPGSYNDTSIWIYSRGSSGPGECKKIEQNDIDNTDVHMANQIVFVFQVNRNCCIFVAKLCSYKSASLSRLFLSHLIESYLSPEFWIN